LGKYVKVDRQSGTIVISDAPIADQCQTQSPGEPTNILITAWYNQPADDTLLAELGKAWLDRVKLEQEFKEWQAKIGFNKTKEAKHRTDFGNTLSPGLHGPLALHK